MRIVTSYSNFSKGQVDSDVNGRFDLPIYNHSSLRFENFFSNFKGNAIYRTGMQDMIGEFQDCVLHEFRFSSNQNYILVFYNTVLRFLTYDSSGNFGWVENGGSPLEVTTPFTLNEARELSFAQNADVMIITHHAHTQQALTRVAADNFTISDYTLTGANFGGENPSKCLFYKGRLYFSNTLSKPTTVWASEAGNFTEFTIPATVTDTSALQFTPSEISDPIDWMFGGENSLLLGSNEGITTVNGGGVSVPIKADTIEADLTTVDGASSATPLKKDSLIFYIGKNGRNTYSFSYDLLTETFVANDSNLVAYDVTKSGITKIRHKKDKNDLIYAVLGDGQLLTNNFMAEPENINGWHLHSTNGNVKDIVHITNNDGQPQIFLLVERNGAFFIERIAQHVEFCTRGKFMTGDKDADEAAYYRKLADEMRDCNYLDNSLLFDDYQSGNQITYDGGAGTVTATSSVFSSDNVGSHIVYKTSTGYELGRFEITAFISDTVVSVVVLQEPTSNTYDDWYLSFSSLGGLSQYNGNEVSVVGDGKYLGDFIVSGGELDLKEEITSIVVGYKYNGITQSFPLGFQIQGENTQATKKSVIRVGIRTLNSAGGAIGTTLYRMEDVQIIHQGAQNYLPPLPMNKTSYVNFSDDHEFDKTFFIAQYAPLPMVITTALVDVSHAVTR